MFFDIDGTLITEGAGVLPESTREAIRLAQDSGHLLFVNTGRTRTSLPQKITELGFDGYVCDCGTQIFLKEEELLHARLTNNLCCQVVKTVREYGIPALYEAADAVYFDYQIPDKENQAKKIEDIFGIRGKDIEEIFQDEQKVYDKLLLILKSTGKSKELKGYLSQYFECIDRGNFMYEVIQKGYSKATGIHFLCEYMGKTLEDCYSFGDSENDRAMLEAVPNSIAMGNAQESIKNTCAYVTEDVENHGIYKAMKHFGLI